MSTGPLNSPKPTTSVIVGGVHNTATPTPADGQALPLQQDANGNLLVNVAVGGGSGSSNVNIANVNGNPPALTNPLPVELSDGTNAFGTAGNPLSVNVITGGGSNASVGATGATAPASATEIGIINGSGNMTGVSPTTPLPVSATAAANASGNPIFVESVTGSTTTVTQGTGSNLHAVLDSGSTTTVTQGTGTNLHVVTDSTSTTAVTQATASNLNAAVVGTLTNNNAAPTTTNVGVLPALANAANPSWTEGDQVLVSVDLSGHQRVVATGAAASGSAVAGNPVLVAGIDSAGHAHNLLVSTTRGMMVVVSSDSAAIDALANNQVNFFYNNADALAAAQVGPLLFNGSTWDRQRSTTIGNGVAATGIAAATNYIQYNTTLPAPTAGQYTAAQCDTVGSTYVNIEGRKATYSAFASFTAVAGDIAVLPGSASKTIRVIRVEVSFTTSGTAAIEAVQLIKRSAADTSGTSASMTAVPHDSNFAGASAAPLNYTVAPTPGAAVGTIRGVQFNDASSLVPGANTWIWDFGSRPSSAIVLRGVAQMLCVNLPTAVATQTATISFEWTEE